jgi:hypothetical protein
MRRRRQLVTLPFVRDPAIVAAFSGFLIRRFCGWRPLAQSVSVPNLPLASRSPVTRSTVKK